MFNIFEKQILRRIMLAIFDKQTRQTTSIFLIYKKLEYDFLINCVQLIIDFYLLLLWFIEFLLKFIKYKNCL